MDNYQSRMSDVSLTRSGVLQKKEKNCNGYMVATFCILISLCLFTTTLALDVMSLKETQETQSDNLETINLDITGMTATNLETR